MYPSGRNYLLKLLAYCLILLFASEVLTACTTIGIPTEQALTKSPLSTTLPAKTPTSVPSHATSMPTEAATAAAPGLTSTPRASISLESLTGKIAYSLEGDIYVMNIDGSGIIRLTNDPAEDFDPAWSPDGTQIAFRSHRDGNEEVYLMPAPLSQAQVNVDGSDQHNLSNAPGGDYSPAWSPDGKWIAFMSDRGGNANIWVMRPDGSDVRQVTDIPGISEYPTWSPDSNRIAFHCTFGNVLDNGTGDFEICVVNTDGTGLTQLTDTPGENKLPAWSPDGEQIAFQSNRNGWPSLPDYEPLGYDPHDFGDYEIFVMNIEGSDQQNLTNNPREDDTFPAWSRDGDLIFSRYGCLMVMNIDDASVLQISKGSCAGTDTGQFPDWYQPEN